MLLLLISVTLFGKSFSQALEKNRLDGYLKVMDTNGKFMGNVLYQRGKNIYSHPQGFSNIEVEAKADDQTMYRIGSISKTITATLILKAIEEGKINLSDNIETFFPSFPQAKEITVSHLLNHHSGIHNFTGGDFINWNTQLKKKE